MFFEPTYLVDLIASFNPSVWGDLGDLHNVTDKTFRYDHHPHEVRSKSDSRIPSNLE